MRYSGGNPTWYPGKVWAPVVDTGQKQVSADGGGESYFCRSEIL